MNKLRMVGIACILCATFAGGCGGKSEADDAAAAPVQPQVDPRLASAQALLDYYNSLTAREPVNPNASLDLFYAENDFQRDLLGMMRNLVVVADLDRVMFDRFHEGWAPHSKKPMLSPDKPATLKKTEPQRAEGEYMSSDSELRTIHLVKIGDRWWVSGYTLEYDPEFKDSSKTIASMKRVTAAVAGVAPGFVSRVQNGEFKAATEVRTALMSELMRNDPSIVPDLRKLFK